MQYLYQAGMKVLNTDIQLVCEKGLNSGNALSKGITWFSISNGQNPTHCAKKKMANSYKL
jgi:hypothetical protein